MPAPFKIVSDNSTSLCANKDVIAFLKSKGVQTVTTITAYNSRANKSERIHKTLRETMRLVQETFKRKSQFDMYHTVVEMVNNRPLSLVLHPHIRKALGGRTETVTPFSLHYGIKPPLHPKVPMEDTLLPMDQETYRQKWAAILSDYDKELQKELNEKNKNFKHKNNNQKAANSPGNKGPQPAAQRPNAGRGPAAPNQNPNQVLEELDSNRSGVAGASMQLGSNSSINQNADGTVTLDLNKFLERQSATIPRTPSNPSFQTPAPTGGVRSW
jgi:hypothetical protein